MAGLADYGDLWIRRFHPVPESDVRLICFPHVGGSASYFFPLSDSLRPSIEVLAVQYPGRQDRGAEECIQSVSELADEIFAALRPWADRPVALFGHSMGAVLAFEVATRFEERSGAALAGLFVSGRRAPSRWRDENVHRRDDDGLVAELKLLSGTDSALLGDEELLRMIMPAIRSDYTAVETYVYRPGRKLTCPVTALVGDDDPRTTVDEAQAWREHTSGSFELQVFPGGHFYLNAHQTAVGDVISDQLISTSIEWRAR